ncbi:hypothetical protein ACF0H5_010900 [Mactra antiquata]
MWIVTLRILQILRMTMYEGDEYIYESENTDWGNRPLKDVTNGYIKAASCSRDTKIRRLSGTDQSSDNPSTSLQLLDSSTLRVLPELQNGNSIDDLCVQLDSVDMCLNGDMLHCPSGTKPETETKINSPEVEVAYRKDKDGDTLLHLAIIHVQTVLSFNLIDLAPSPKFISMKNYMLQSPLHLAVLLNLPRVVRRLIVAGAEIDSRNKQGNTPLHLACRDGHIEIVRHLLEPVRYQEIKQNKYEIPYQKIPQDLFTRSYEGLTVLHLAAMNKHLDIVELLTEKEINLNLQEGKAGRTILHWACNQGDIKLVRLLLRHRSCNINARAYDGSTPFDLARDGGHDLVCMTLAAAGARHGEEEYSDSD